MLLDTTATLRKFKLFLKVENALKAQLFNSLDKELVSSLQHPLCSDSGVILLHHIEMDYASLDCDQLSKTLVTLDEPWEPAQKWNCFENALPTHMRRSRAA